MENSPNQIEKRKRDHLQPFRNGGVSSRRASTWLECVHFVHNALPELSADELDISADWCGRKFMVPLFITGMTGGTAEAGEINRALARVAEQMGMGLGLGSGRAMLADPRLSSTYQVRSVAPRVFLAWNLGGTQLASTPLDMIQKALDQLQADAICIHLNPAQEMMQSEGDRDFRGVLASIGKLVRFSKQPVIVKETGAGINRKVGLMLIDVGVKHIDVAGTGGTSWVGVELMRHGRDRDPEALAFWDWGIPTAAAICDLAGCGCELIASGGIRTGLDAARAIALGADLAGVAAPIIQAYFQGGERGCSDALRHIVLGLKTAMVLTGCSTLPDLRKADRRISGPLKEWIENGSDSK